MIDNEQVSEFSEVPEGPIVVSLMESAINNFHPKDYGITKMERVFPDAGEFEAKHRKAGLHKWYFVEFGDDVPSTKAGDILSSIPGVEHFEAVGRPVPNAAFPFNDPFAYNQWHLYNNGSLGASFTSGADINVLPVWNNITGGKNNVIVAVLDTGVQNDHPDLKGVVLPPGEGGSRSFLNSCASHPYEYNANRHGTHCAGIIAAINNNGTGGCGVAGGTDGNGGVLIMDCQTIASDSTDSGNIYQAAIWAADNGAVIASNSWNISYSTEAGTPATTPVLYSAVIDYFVENAGTDANGNQTGPMKGGLVLFSAGNKSWTRSQPSMYEKVIAVASTGPAGEKASYTNYGDWVDICAPGGNYNGHGNDGQIYSTVSGSSYAWMQGTSMACPVVSGVAALLLSQFGGPGFTPDDLRKLLLDGANYADAPSGGSLIGPRVDAFGSFAEKLYVPEPTDDIACTAMTKTSATVEWSVKGYGGEPLYAYKAVMCEDKSKLKNLDPMNIPSGVRQRSVSSDNKSIGTKVSTIFYQIPENTWMYFTAVGYSRNYRYTVGNKIDSLMIRKNLQPELELMTSAAITLNHSQKHSVGVKYSDPNGDALSFTLVPGSDAAEWSDDGAGKLTLSIDGNGAPAGSYTASAEVSDGELEDAVEIPYTILPNTAPEITEPIDNYTIYLGGSPLSIFPNVYFKDAEADKLTFTVIAEGDVVRVESDSEGIKAYALKVGVDRITITASDGYGGSATQQFSLRVQGNTSGLDIYPQEVVDKLYITAASVCNSKIQLLNSSGKVIFSKTVTQDPYNPYYVDMRNCAPGFYIVRVSMNGRSTEQKVLKK